MLVAEYKATRWGEGLDFEALIETPTFEEIRLHLLQSGSEQMVNRLKTKYPDLNLSCQDDEDVGEAVDHATSIEGIRTGEASNPGPAT